MAIFSMKKIGNEMAREALERFMHERLSSYIREEMAKPNPNARNVAINALVRLRDSSLLQMIRSTLGADAAGLGLTAVGAGLAEWLKDQNWLDYLPDEKHSVMREVRYLLQIVVPSMVVGTAEGIGDSWQTDVEKAFDKVRSNDASLAPKVKPAVCDFACVPQGDTIRFVREHGFGLLFPVWKDDGTLELDSREMIVLHGPDGLRFMDMWYKEHPGKYVDVPNDAPQNNQNQNNNRGNNNNQPRMKTVWQDGAKYQFRIVPLAQAIEALPAPMIADPELRAAAKAALKPKETPPAPAKAEVSADGKLFMTLLSKAASKQSPLENKLIIDLAQDIANDPVKINHLAERFLTQANRTSGLSHEDVRAIMTHMEMWQGSKLTLQNKIRLALDHARHVFENARDRTGRLLPLAERREQAIGVFVHAIGKWTLVTLTVLIALFATSLFHMIAGAFFINLEQPTGLSLNDALAFIPVLIGFVLILLTEGWTRFFMWVLTASVTIPAFVLLIVDAMERLAPNEFAVALVAFGGFLACAELFSFTAIQALLGILTQFFPNIQKDWLVNKGRILIMFIAIHMGIFIILLSVNAPWLLRILICVPTFFALASQMGLSAYDFGEEARLRARKTMRLFSSLTLVTFVVTVGVLVLQHNHLTVLGVFAFIMSSRVLQSVVILALAGYVAAIAVRRIEVSGRTIENGIVTETTYKRMNWLRISAFVIVLILVAYPWYKGAVDTFYNQPATVQTVALPVSKNTVNKKKEAAKTKASSSHSVDEDLPGEAPSPEKGLPKKAKRGCPDDVPFEYRSECE